MERHASMPYGNDFQRVLHVITERGQLIEKDVPEASAHNESDSHIEKQVLKHGPVQPEPFSPSLFSDEEIGGGETKHVHKSVPTKLDGPDLNDVWIYVGKWQQGS